MPSAVPAKGKRALHGGARVLHMASRSALWLVGLGFVLIGGLFLLLATRGIENSYFTAAARDAVQRISGPNLAAVVDNARLSINDRGNLAFDASGISFKRADGAQFVKIDTMNLGLKLFSLIGGSIEIGSVKVSGINFAQSQTANGSGIFATLLDQNGLVSPAKLPTLINDGLRKSVEALELRGLDRITLDRIKFDSLTPLGAASIETITLQKGETGGFDLSGGARLGASAVEVAGRLNSRSYAISFSGINFGDQIAYDPAANAGELIQKVPFHGTADLNISGLLRDATDTIQLGLITPEFDFQNSRRARVTGRSEFRMELRTGAEKVEILPSSITVGQNSSRFTGAFGPAPKSDAGDKPVYRFELISNDTRLMPADSPENEVMALGRVAGTFDQISREMTFSEIGVRTKDGEVFGRGSLRFGTGSPELIFALRIPRMKVQEAKQLWPSLFASGGRRWVLNNVFGGTLLDSTINVSFAQGVLWPKKDPNASLLPTADQVNGQFRVENARVDITGDLPPIRDAAGIVDVSGANTTITITHGTAYLEDGRIVDVKEGVLKIPVMANAPVIAELDVKVEGAAGALAEVANRDPIRALDKSPVQANEVSGDASAHVIASFPLRRADASIPKTWQADVNFSGLSVSKDFNGQKLTDATGSLEAGNGIVVFNAKGKLNGIPASVSVKAPMDKAAGKPEVQAKLNLDDDDRAKLAPGLADILRGPVSLELIGSTDGKQNFEAGLELATLSLPWAGWAKGAGVPGRAVFSLSAKNGITKIEDLKISGSTFSIAGSVTLEDNNLSKADFSRVSLNKGDNVSVSIERVKGGYAVEVNGKSLDLRALLKRVSGNFEKATEATGGAAVRLRAKLNSVLGFNGERLENVIASYYGVGSEIKSFAASATSSSGSAVSLDNSSEGGQRRVAIQTADGGALLRFMDIYDKMDGGSVAVNLVSGESGVLSGEVDARSFTVVGEPRLKTLVGAPSGPDGKPVTNAKGKIDVSRVRFERGSAFIEKGKGFLRLKEGILRSEQIGLSYAGTLYDAKGRINMTGTYLPAFGLNRIFGELPIFGEILGNGRDKGLIGITFKLVGDAKSPTLSVNPISIIAPGIFRKIFEFQ